MSTKKIYICVLTFLLCLGFTGAVIAADFGHSMTFTSKEIDSISSMGSSMYAAISAADFGDSMTFTSKEIDSISSMDTSMYAAAHTADFGDSMTFTSKEIDSIGPVNRGVLCIHNC